MKRRLNHCIVILMTACFLLSAAGCSSNKEPDLSTPSGITEAFLEHMKAGEYSEACEVAGTKFDEEAYENSVQLQKNVMKETYAQMDYEIVEEKIEEDESKAGVTVKITNINYIDTLNDAVYETMQANEDDEYTEELYKEAMKEAERNESTVLVSYRKDEGKWVFDGSNSQLYAAMLGYLQETEDGTAAE